VILVIRREDLASPGATIDTVHRLLRERQA